MASSNPVVVTPPGVANSYGVLLYGYERNEDNIIEDGFAWEVVGPFGTMEEAFAWERRYMQGKDRAEVLKGDDIKAKDMLARAVEICTPDPNILAEIQASLG